MKYPIQTKSFLDKKRTSDGFRICVMRRFDAGYDFDYWFPCLAPSEELLTAYVKKKTMRWMEFSKRYKKEILDTQTLAIRCIAMMTDIAPVTLLCWEKDEKYCHRVLIKRAVVSSTRLKNISIHGSMRAWIDQWIRK